MDKLHFFQAGARVYHKGEKRSGVVVNYPESSYRSEGGVFVLFDGDEEGAIEVREWMLTKDYDRYET